jgi:isopentenyldiphosphate isomerase
VTELLDIYDEDLKWLGTKERGAVHRDGDWHKVFHCWVAYRDADGKDYLVVQRRGPDTAVFPNYLDITAAGHYQAGETVRDGIREVREELGIDVDFDHLIPLGVHISVGRFNGIVDRQFADVFLYIYDQDIADYHYQVEEVAGLVALPVDEGLAMFAGEREQMTVRAVGVHSGEIAITLADFIATPDSYTYKMLILAKRALNGEKHLRV